MAKPISSDYWNRRGYRIEEILESGRAAVAFAGAALKSAILLNGAAALAVLAFIANQWSAAAGGETVNDAALLVPPLRHFVIGVFSAVLATGVGYLSAYAENRGLWYWVEDRETVYKTMFALMWILQGGAIALVIYAYVRFWLGMDAGIDALIV